MKKLTFIILLTIVYSNYGTDCDFITLDGEEIPSGYYIRGCYPQPCSMTNYIFFGLPDTSRIELNIYDISGDSLREGIYCIIPGGKYKFNCNDFLYIPDCKSGVYFAKLNAVPKTESKKIKNVFSGVEKFLIVK